MLTVFQIYGVASLGILHHWRPCESSVVDHKKVYVDGSRWFYSVNTVKYCGITR